MAKLTIDRGIPLPARQNHGGRKPAIPWHRLEVGDSVLATTETMAKNAKAWAERNGRTFTRAKQPDGTGWRIWRKA